MIKPSMLSWIIFPIFMLLTGCSGSGEGSSQAAIQTAPPAIAGVAAAGSTLAGTVYLKDSSLPAQELSVPIAVDGSFSFDLNGLTPPYLLKAVGTAGGSNLTLYSFATAAGITNINPLSSLAVALANGSDDLATTYSSADPVKMNAVKSALASAVATVQTQLEPTLAKFGAGGVNFITDPYLANHQGLDLLFDMASFSAANGVLTIVDKPAANTVLIPFSSFMTGTIDIISAPLTPVGSVISWPGVSAVAPNATIAFATVVVGIADQGVSWSVVEEGGGSITDNGVYTAPEIYGSYHVKATSAADPTRSQTALVVVRRENALTLSATGPGVYSVMASDFANVGGVEVEITYDRASLANPRVTPATLASNTMFIANTNFAPDKVKFALMSLNAISGSGPLATISFDLLGSVATGPVVSRVTISILPRAPVTGAGTTVPADSGGGTSLPVSSLPGATATGTVTTALPL